MSFLSHAPPLEGLSPSHGAFQEHAAHTLEWSKVLSSKGSMGTCIPEGVSTFFHTASRRTERRLEAVRCSAWLDVTLLLCFVIGRKFIGSAICLAHSRGKKDFSGTLNVAGKHLSLWSPIS